MSAYAWLEDSAERTFLETVEPAEVLANAHRAYAWLEEREIAPDSVIREACFTKASDALGIDYDVLYNAWLDERPVSARWVAARDLQVGDYFDAGDHDQVEVLTAPAPDPNSPQGRWTFQGRDVDTDRVQTHQTQPHFAFQVFA